MAWYCGCQTDPRISEIAFCRSLMLRSLRSFTRASTAGRSFVTLMGAICDVSSTQVWSTHLVHFQPWKSSDSHLRFLYLRREADRGSTAAAAEEEEEEEEEEGEDALLAGSIFNKGTSEEAPVVDDDEDKEEEEDDDGVDEGVDDDNDDEEEEEG